MTRSYVCHNSYLDVDMTHMFVCHDSFVCVTWLIHMCAIICFYRPVGIRRNSRGEGVVAHVCHDSCVPACTMTHSFVCHILIHIYMRHDSFILIYTCDMTYSYVCHVCMYIYMRHDLYIPAPWLIHTCARTRWAMGHIHAYMHIRTYPSAISHSYVWHNAIICVPWLLHIFAIFDIRPDAFTFVLPHAYRPVEILWSQAAGCKGLLLAQGVSIYMCIHTYTYTNKHTHTYTHIYIYLYM